MLDPNFLLDEERFVWIKSHEVRGEEWSQLVPLVKGEVPEWVFISGAASATDGATSHGPVSRMLDGGFCGREHDSRICRAKFEKRKRVNPCCCHCGGLHNAGSCMQSEAAIKDYFPLQ